MVYRKITAKDLLRAYDKRGEFEKGREMREAAIFLAKVEEKRARENKSLYDKTGNFDYLSSARENYHNAAKDWSTAGNKRAAKRCRINYKKLLEKEAKNIFDRLFDRYLRKSSTPPLEEKILLVLILGGLLLGSLLLGSSYTGYSVANLNNFSSNLYGNVLILIGSITTLIYLFKAL